MRFSMVSALQKWPNFLKLAMKWPNLATLDKIPKTESTAAEAELAAVVVLLVFMA